MRTATSVRSSPAGSGGASARDTIGTRAVASPATSAPTIVTWSVDGPARSATKPCGTSSSSSPSRRSSPSCTSIFPPMGQADQRPDHVSDFEELLLFVGQQSVDSRHLGLGDLVEIFFHPLDFVARQIAVLLQRVQFVSGGSTRSEERRVGEECRDRGS